VFPGYESAGPAASLSFAPGAVLGGRYKLAEIIGHGRTSFVHRSTDLIAPGSSIAVKILRRSLRNKSDEAALLIAEGSRMKAFIHPNIARLHDAGLEDGVPYLVMEELTGGSLRDITRSGTPISAERAADLLEGAARAARFLHAAGWVHADIKPGNLLLDRHGRIKLVDFESARRISTRTEPLSERIVTPSYASPEVIEGAPPEPRDDVFALGIVAYELIAGRHPFDYRPARQTDIVSPPPGLSRRAWASLGAALAPRRADRPTDPLALVRALRTSRPLARLFRRPAPCPA
jgi:serine/threonine protein kinase